MFCGCGSSNLYLWLTDPDADPGGPKHTDDTEQDPGADSDPVTGTYTFPQRLKSHKEVTKQLKSRLFLLFLLNDGNIRSRIRIFFWLRDPDATHPGGPKTFRSYGSGSGSATLIVTYLWNCLWWLLCLLGPGGDILFDMLNDANHIISDDICLFLVISILGLLTKQEISVSEKEGVEIRRFVRLNSLLILPLMFSRKIWKKRTSREGTCWHTICIYCSYRTKVSSMCQSAGTFSAVVRMR